MNFLNDLQIVDDIINKKETAMNHVMAQYAKLMWHIVQRVLKNIASSEDVEECVADIFIYLWQNPEKYDAKRGNLKMWLSVVAKSKAIDKYRQLSKTKQTHFDEEILVKNGVFDKVGGLEKVLSEELKLELRNALTVLEETDREIIIRRYYYQQKPKNISFALDLSVKQVENRLYKSKLKLRHALQNGGNLYEK